MSPRSEVQSSKKEKAEKRRKRATDAFNRLQRAAALAASAADASLAPFGLSASQLGVLEALDSRGPLHQQELARILGRSKAQMTAIIDALEQKGLVARERHASDRRFTTVQIGEAGLALLAEAGPVRSEAVMKTMSLLSGDQKTRLARLCRRIVKELAPNDSGDDDEDGSGSSDDQANDS